MSTFLMIVGVWIGWALIAGLLLLAGWFCWFFVQERRERSRPGYLDQEVFWSIIERSYGSRR